MMMENKRCGELMIENHWMDKLLKEVLMIDKLSIVETDKVNHTVEMDTFKLVVEVESFGKCVDEFDKVIVLFGAGVDAAKARSGSGPLRTCISELFCLSFHVGPSELDS
ncbi:hypothetical protein Tco_0000849 [Tanacetum coccineum]